MGIQPTLHGMHDNTWIWIHKVWSGYCGMVFLWENQRTIYGMKVREDFSRFVQPLSMTIRAYPARLAKQKKRAVQACAYLQFLRFLQVFSKSSKWANQKKTFKQTANM